MSSNLIRNTKWTHSSEAEQHPLKVNVEVSTSSGSSIALSSSGLGYYVFSVADWGSNPHKVTKLYNGYMDKERLGTAGWIGLGAYVAAWDYLAPETLTHAHKRYSTIIRVGTIAVTSAHLMGVIPRRYDPFYWPMDSGIFPDRQVDKGPTIDDSM